MDSEKKPSTISLEKVLCGPVGAHTSAAGGVHKALIQGDAIGAGCIQLFTANQKTWKTNPIPDEEVKRWEKARSELSLTHIMSHDSYLINLASPREEVYEKSLGAVEREIERCFQLDLDFMNFHPGAALDSPVEQALDKIVTSILKMAHLFDNNKEKRLRLLIETTAGQGSTLGSRFEEISYLIENTHKHIPIGVCLDTCHCFAAGYDLSSPNASEHSIEQFDRTIGLEHLYAIHLNDSVGALGSRKDRHAHLGEGEIGLKGLETFVSHPKIAPLPKYLETPGGPERWKDEIPLVYSMVKTHAHKR
jgi:deoxyribonuclease IV